MKSRTLSCALQALTFAILVLLTLDSSARAQAQARAMITAPIDETKLVTLKGNVPPQLKGATDLGAADAGQASGRLLLVLRRPAEREAALQSFLDQAHSASSPGYHKWLAAGEFGKRFGADDSDVAQVQAWLESHGLKVTNVSPAKNAIEFSGTIGQVNEALHTAIHKYSVKNLKTGAMETHYANATDPRIPAALTAAVAGVTHLNDFKPQPQLVSMGKSTFNPKTHSGTPQWTYGEGTGNPPLYYLAPEDFTTQYDVAPAYAAGITGAGVTIGIINENNIDISLVNSFRKLFGLAYNPPQVIIDGNDPGIGGATEEAYLDVENAGAIAPNATVNLYIAGSFGLLGDGGLEFSLLRAVNDDAASVLSLSFGGAEGAQGTAGNEFFNSLWEEAAAQGQTVLVSSGDSGSYDDFNGLGVSGLSSTPWDIAVGGTDAYFTDYATGGKSVSTYWNTANDANDGSLKKKFAEQPWDSSVFGLNSTLYDPMSIQLSYTQGGGGGASSCVVSTFDPNTYKTTCISGYPKPGWQVGTGVPADGVRDVPDVSLFASNGWNGILWPVCAFEGDCAETDPVSGETYVTGVGGTSASAPAMAGIMALVNQKYGPQGQANYTLYPLAAQFPAAFNDITVGSNNELCSKYDVGYFIGCALDTNGDGYYSYQNYSATKGYDQASGLGSVDVNELLTDWPKVTFATSGTTLSLAPTTITHGGKVTATAAVTGTGTPAGAVSIVANTTLANNKSVSYIQLADGKGSETLTNLPGGTYSVVGQYSGDGINGASTSSPVTMTVNPEASQLAFTPQYYSPTTYKPVPIKSGDTVPYGSAILFDATIGGATGQFDGAATGTVTFTNGGSAVNTAVVSSYNSAEFNASSLPPGSYTIAASYSGDASYNASTAAPIAFTIGQAGIQALLLPDSNASYNQDGSYGYLAGQAANIAFLASPNIYNGGACPTGPVTFQLGKQKPITAMLSAACENIELGYVSVAYGLFPDLPAGTYTLTVTYAGDANFQGSTLTQAIEVAPSHLIPSTVTLTTTPSNLTAVPASTIIYATFTATGKGSVAPTGTVTAQFANFLGFAPVKLTPVAGTDTSSATVVFRGSDLLQGANVLTATYSGDKTYAGSVSTAQLITDDPTDFILQSPATVVTVSAGYSVPIPLTLTSVAGFNGTVTVGCTVPAGLTCAQATTSVALNGTSTTQVTVNTVTSTTATAANRPAGTGWMRAGAGTALACLAFFCVPRRRRLGRAFFGLAALLVLLSSGLGCGSSTKTVVTGPTSQIAKPGTYTAVITGTGSNGVVHNAKVTVIVQ